MTPTCQDCGRDGERDRYKGDQVFRCPDCERILLRQFGSP